MILWWGEKRKVKQVKDGELFRETCPKCGVRAVFVECIVESTLAFYSVLDFGSDAKRVMVCTECQEQFRYDFDGAKRPAERGSESESGSGSRSGSGSPSATATATATATGPAPAPARGPRVSAKSPEIADRLAALKAKMKK